MGVRVVGMDELLRDLRTLPDRAGRVFPKVLSKGGLNIKGDWRRRWTEATRPGRRGPYGHIPHLLRGIGYDTSALKDAWSATIGVDSKNRQAFLSKILTYGTLTSGPHDAGLAALDVEDPRFVQAVADAAVELLDGS